MTETEYDVFESGIGITTLESDRGAVENLQEDSPIAINGVAIPENTVLQGGRGERHYYPPEMAQEAAEILQQQIDDGDTKVHLVKNFHELEGQAPADDIIGEVTGAGYSPGVGVVFNAETADEETAQKINLGYLEVSPTVARGLGQHDETMDARAVNEVAGFRDVAVVGTGQPGSKVEVGQNPAVEVLSRAVIDPDTDRDEETPIQLDSLRKDKDKYQVTLEGDEVEAVMGVIGGTLEGAADGLMEDISDNLTEEFGADQSAAILGTIGGILSSHHDAALDDMREAVSADDDGEDETTEDTNTVLLIEQ